MGNNLPLKAVLPLPQYIALILRLWILFLLVDHTSEFNTDVSITEPQFPRSFMVPFSEIRNTIAILYYPAAKSD